MDTGLASAGNWTRRDDGAVRGDRSGVCFDGGSWDGARQVKQVEGARVCEEHEDLVEGAVGSLRFRHIERLEGEEGFDLLPDEVVIRVFSFLGDRDLASMREVCSRFASLVKMSDLEEAFVLDESLFYAGDRARFFHAFRHNKDWEAQYAEALMWWERNKEHIDLLVREGSRSPLNKVIAFMQQLTDCGAKKTLASSGGLLFSKFGERAIEHFKEVGLDEESRGWLWKVYQFALGIAREAAKDWKARLYEEVVRPALEGRVQELKAEGKVALM